jgi:hypothetical protein
LRFAFSVVMVGVGTGTETVAVEVVEAVLEGSSLPEKASSLMTGTAVTPSTTEVARVRVTGE